MNELYTGLKWLPPAPEDFAARVRALSGHTDRRSADRLSADRRATGRHSAGWKSVIPDAAGATNQRATDRLGTELQALAAHALDLNQLTRLAKAMKRLRAEGSALDPLTPFKLAILSNATVDFIVPGLVSTAARHGVALEIIQPSYDQVAQEALTPDSRVNSAQPDAVLFALDYRALPLKLSLGDSEAAAATVEGVLGYLRMLREGIKSHSHAVCIFQTFAAPVETLFGSL